MGLIRGRDPPADFQYQVGGRRETAVNAKAPVFRTVLAKALPLLLRKGEGYLSLLLLR